MTKDLITIIDQNLQYLKSCLDLTEAHITWGTKDVKEKYSKVKERLLNKIQEEKVYRNLYMNPIKNTTPNNDKTYIVIDKLTKENLVTVETSPSYYYGK
tara:strand:- start:51 stop:347 length:297 start_codon:yes stop_codon:yes gene_type:complete